MNYCHKCYSEYEDKHLCKGKITVIDPFSKNPINNQALNELSNLFASGFKIGDEKEIAQESFMEGYERAVQDMQIYLYLVNSIKEDIDEINEGKD